MLSPSDAISIDMVSIEIVERYERHKDHEERQRVAVLYPIQYVWYNYNTCVIYKVVCEPHVFFVLYNNMTEKYVVMKACRNFYYGEDVTKNHIGARWMTRYEFVAYLKSLDDQK